VKRFSTVRDTQRGSDSYMEKRRGRREIEVARRRKGIKRGEQSKQNEKTEKYSAGKERDKFPPNQTKEEEIESLPEK